MTKRVTRKAFKNGGSVAVRIPKGWLPEDAEIDVIQREDGVIEVRALSQEDLLKALALRILEQGELNDSEVWLPNREQEPERWNWNEMLKDEPA